MALNIGKLASRSSKFRRLVSRRRALPIVAATALVATALVVLPRTAALAAVSCNITYTQSWSNQSQFGANVVINNTGDAVNGWSLVFNFPNSATIQNGWPVAFAQSGTQVTISSNAQWNQQIASGGSFTVGFNANGQFAQPASFTFNGVTCGGGQLPQALVVNPVAVNVPEAGNATFAVRLQTQPSANVTVTSTAGSGDTNITVSAGGTLTFTPANWQTTQNVTLSASEDADTANGQRTITVASSGLPSVTVTATEADNDGAQALVVTPTAVSVPEGGTGSYTVRLQAQPSANVSVTSTAGSGDTNITVSAGGTLTFTSANWQTPQTVTLAAAQDADTTNGSRTITVASSGLPSVTVTATEADDDPVQQQAVILSATTLNVPEGGCATVTVRLSIQPSGNVTVSASLGSGDGDITIQSGGTLTFTTANWSTPQNVSICAAEDADTTNGSRTISFAAPGATGATLTATEVDNDPVQQQSLIVVPTTVSVPEGLTAGFTVRLNTQPAANVTVTTTAGTGDTNLTVSAGGSLTFSTANWNTNQTVTLAAAQDADTTNGSRAFTVASTGIPSVTVTATESDDDVPPGQKAENPYASATGYVNPDWQAQVNAEANTRTGALANQMRNIANTPTAVWMDRIGAITAGRGLAGHLNAAVAQDAANGAQPVVITIVIYDLPNRDCAALASNGELLIANGGMTRYQNEYITPIRNILAQSAYANLRISLIIEVDSLPNLVTNLSTPKCSEANGPGGYVDGIRFAINQLSPLSNTYLYLDIAHSGWLGWPNNFDGILQVMDRTLATGQGGPGYDKIHGFITNSANYTPTEEIFLTNPQLQVGGQQVMASTFFEFNPRFDERDFATDLRTQFQNRGCNAPNTCGMLIDTSRNGWGGPNRPTAVSTSTDLNTYVNQSKIDRRPHRGGWCNQNGAGIGARPTANTGITGVDAFVWVKPPGESDGVSEAGIIDPEDPAKGFDAMCDPDAQNRYNNAFGTNALPNAPHAGRWFPAQFAMLVQNAFPAIPST
jgi:cellulose 1,4-beta-cellobiosidase